MADRIQRRSDVADARFERALGEMNGQVEKDVVIAQAQARLEARKARLALLLPERPPKSAQLNSLSVLVNAGKAGVIKRPYLHLLYVPRGNRS